MLNWWWKTLKLLQLYNTRCSPLWHLISLQDWWKQSQKITLNESASGSKTPYVTEKQEVHVCLTWMLSQVAKVRERKDLRCIMIKVWFKATAASPQLQTLYFGPRWFIVSKPVEMNSPLGKQLCLCMNTWLWSTHWSQWEKKDERYLKGEAACQRAHTKSVRMCSCSPGTLWAKPLITLYECNCFCCWFWPQPNL